MIEHAVGAILVLLLVGGMANILLRLTEGGGLIWFNDVSRYLLVWVTFLGAAAASFHRAHITVNEEIVAGLSPGLRRLARLLRQAVVILFLLVVVYEGTRLTLQVSKQSFLTIRWLSLSFGYVALPISAALMLAAAVLWAVRDARGEERGR
ncbi:MAG: TRAP transporter small permease subunit [Hyphomicrobiales bacterium]|nr:TRAP transporter small permease subunit [Hyphomicrobiales bacterium]